MQDSKFWEHARAIYVETGIYIPLLGTPEGDKAYELWAEWVLANMIGDKPDLEAKALTAVEELERGLLCKGGDKSLS